MNDGSGQFTLIGEGTDYALHAADNGAAFVLRFKTDHLTAHLGDDDASRFRADYDGIRAQYPTWQMDQMLAQLWDQGGYGWLATEDGC